MWSAEDSFNEKFCTSLCAFKETSHHSISGTTVMAPERDDVQYLPEFACEVATTC
jgi:hypothetical protein